MLSRIILLFVFLVFATNRPTSFVYLGFFVVLIATFMHIIGKKKVRFNKLSSIDFVPLYFLLIWAYGVVVGLLNKNNLSYIIENNAGLVLYILYYSFIQARLSKEKLLRTIMYGALFAGILTLIIFFLMYIFGIGNNPIFKILVGEFATGSSTGQNRVYFLGQLCIFVPLCIYLAKITMSKMQILEWESTAFSQRNIVKDSLLFFACVCVTVFFTASKGFMLGFCFLFLMIPILIFTNSLKRGVISGKFIFYLSVLFLVLVALLSLNYSNIITAIFSEQDDANVLRFEQLYYIWNDLNFWGNGSGAVVPGYERNLDKPYGFELSYINLIHKVGFLAIVIFILFINFFFKCFKQIIRNEDSKYAIAALGSMTYLFIAIGNPILFAPQSVLLHCVAIYFIRSNNYERSNG
jgi:hypothetical protein